MKNASNFVVASGEMPDRVREHDWAGTPLGSPEKWSHAVRAAVNNVLSSPFPACACFGKDLVMVYNDAFTPILGDKHPALGTRFSDTWEEAWHVIGPIARKALNGQATFIPNFPLRIKRRADCFEDAYFTFSYSPLHDGDGAVIGMLDSVFETTATVETELRLQERAHESELVLEQTELALRQSQKLESVGRLTGGIAHDFNNLLQVISGNLQLLALEVKENDLALVRLEGALSGVQRGARLTSHLLAFSRKQTLDPTVVDVGLVLTAMDDMLARTLGAACEIQIQIERGVWNALVDVVQLESAVLNLCINARDAMEGVGQLTIEVRNITLDEPYAAQNAEVSPGEYIMLAVSDTGSGMSPEVLEKVFEPFFTTKPEGKGTGLGLSMVFGFTKQSGGHVKIYSEPGHGTTVRLYLPRSYENPAEVVPDSSLGDLRGGSETILVVDDDVEVRDTVVALLQRLGYTVFKAGDAAGALAIVESGIPIDLLFTDVVMPGPLRSPALAEKVRKAQPNIAVLFTSGFTENAIVHSGRLKADVELLAKPYSHELLADKIRHTLAAQARRNDARKLRQEKTPEASAQNLEHHHILFVDDDPVIREVTAEVLRAMGHRVTVAADAEEALQLFSVDVTVLISDVVLPGQSGQALASSIRERSKRVGVVFATGGEVDSLIPNAVHLRKPYEPEELSDAVRKAWKAAG